MRVASLSRFALEVYQLGVGNNLFFFFLHAEETGYSSAHCVSFIKENKMKKFFHTGGNKYGVGIFNVFNLL